MPTQKFKSKIVKKKLSHQIIMTKLRKLYIRDTLNVRELARLTDIEYYRMRRLLYEESAEWYVDEWFKVMAICDAETAIPQLYNSTRDELVKYQASKRYKSRLPKTPGPLKNHADKEV